MNQNVMIHVKSNLNMEDTMEHVVVSSRGTYSEKGTTKYICYDEVTNDQVNGEKQVTKTILKLKPQMLEIIRHGEMKSHMVFIKDKELTSFYPTVAGTIELIINTAKLIVVEQENSLRIDLGYNIFIRNQLVTQSDIQIDIREA